MGYWKVLTRSAIRASDTRSQRRRKFTWILVERLAHPPYSLALSPCEFSFFGRARTALQNRRLADENVPVEALTDLFHSITFEELQSVFQNWIERLKWVIRHNEEYFIQ
jgi:hypothetical protein